MAIRISCYLRRSPNDNSFGRPALALPDDDPDLPTQRGYRFSGFKLTLDADGNIIKTYTSENMNPVSLAHTYSTATIVLR